MGGDKYMIIQFYGMAFILSVLFFMVLVMIGQRQKITNYLLLFMAIMIGNLGHYVICTAASLADGIRGNNLVYLGGVLIPLFLLVSIANLCRKPVHKLLLLFLSLFACIIIYYAFQVGVRTDFYSSVRLVSVDGVSFLQKEYGKMHNLYLIYVLLCMALGIGILVVAFSQKKKLSYKIILWLFAAQVLSVGVYAGERMLHSRIEWTTLMYLLDEILILALIRRIGMYEVSDNIASALEAHSTYGYLVFDNRHRYLGCNEKGKEYLPEVENLWMDRQIGKEEDFLYENIEKKLEKAEEKDAQEYYIVRNGREFRCSVRPLLHGAGKKQIGFMVEIEDDTQRRKYVRLLHDYNMELEKAVEEKTQHISDMQDKMLLGMADIIESRDSSTGGHVKRTSEVIRIFTRELEKSKESSVFPKNFLAYVTKAAPMHDLGKVAVDDRILRKPGKFTQEEFEEMKNHAGKGGEIVSRVLQGVEDEDFIRIAENIAHYHHEKWNGEGYPEHLFGTDIPLEARIMALADVFDALVSKRCYKDSMNYDNAFQIIEESLGSHFDPELGKKFLGCREQLITYYETNEPEG